MTNNIVRLVDEQVYRSSILREAAKSAGTEPALPHGPTIVISRQLASGGKLVAEKLAQKLGYTLWDKNLVDAVANDAYVSRRIVEAFDEHTVSDIEQLARIFAGQPDAGGFLYKRHLARALLSISKHGDAVIVGRGANFILPDALSVRVIASEDLRVRNLVEFEGLTQDEACHRIRASDRDRAAFIKSVYGKDINEPLAYDLMAVADCFGTEGIADLVIAALGSRREECWRGKA